MSSKLQTYPFLHTVNKLQQINTTTIKERLSRKPHKLSYPHRTQFFQIYLFTEGNGQHIVDFESLEVCPSHILFISQGQVHAFDPKESYDGKALIFTEDFFCRTDLDRKFLQSTFLFDHTFHQAYFKIHANFEKLKQIFNDIHLELNRAPDKQQREILHNLLYRILLLSEREFDEQVGVKKIFSTTETLAIKFKQEVEQNFKAQKNISFYNNLLHVGIRKLQLATMATFNKTPKEIIHDRVLLEAKRLLAYDELLVKEVADHLGFEEPTNFIKFFKLKTGYTPIEFKSTL